MNKLETYVPENILKETLLDYILVVTDNVKQTVFNIVSNFVEPEELYKLLKRKS